jgi:hypothetical protein
MTNDSWPGAGLCAQGAFQLRFRDYGQVVKLSQYFFLALVLLCASHAHAARFKQIGHMEKHPDSQPRDLLGGMQDLYFSGDKVCMPATPEHAAECRKPGDWVVTDIGTTTITLEDGSSVEVERNGRERKSVFDRVVEKWISKRLVRNAMSQHYDPDDYGAAAVGTFHYRLRKRKNVPYQIDIKGIGKGPYPSPGKSAVAVPLGGTPANP